MFACLERRLALEERNADRFPGGTIDEPVAALETRELLRGRDNGLLDELDAGFELVRWSLELCDTCVHLDPPLYSCWIPARKPTPGCIGQANEALQAIPSSSKERWRSAGSRYTRNAPADMRD